MQAIVYDRYGPPDVLQLREVEDPAIGETDVLVRVRAASAKPLDWFAFNGTPYIARAGFGLKKPASARLGADLAGVVAVGSQVTGVQGDGLSGLVACQGEAGHHGLMHPRYRPGLDSTVAPAYLPRSMTAMLSTAATCAMCSHGADPT
jgi:NADPH:quinone reductase-like Zn-dependent oxidoreductase